MPVKRLLCVLMTVISVCTLLMVPASAANPQYANQLLEGQTFTMEQAAAVRGAVEYMPENLMAYLMSTGLQVDTENDCPNAERSTGTCEAMWKNVVYVYENALAKSVVHEFGHAYAMSMSLIPRALYNRYKDTLKDILPAYALKDEQEFWADCFAFTIIDPEGIGEDIAQAAPAVASVLKQAIELNGALFREGDMSVLHVFSDVHSRTWHAAAINEAALRGIVLGKTPDQYDPTSLVTRAEGIQGVFNLRRHADVAQEPLQRDVDPSSWYADAAKWAVKYNAIKDSWKLQLDAGKTITREEMVLAMYSLTRSAGIRLEGDADLTAFLDADEVSEECRDALIWAVTYGIIEDTDCGRLDPNGPLTRAEMAAMLINVSHYLEEHGEG